ncbi:MAG: site-2 protease family protein, partial [Myxococcota bacterium]
NTPGQLTRRLWGQHVSLRKGELLGAAAGPVSNLVLATLCTMGLAVAVRAGADISDPYSPFTLLRGFIVLNLALFVFNLIPIPPLDGSKVLMNVLPRALAYRYERAASSLSWVLLLLVIFAGGVIIRPIVGLLTGVLSLLL